MRYNKGIKVLTIIIIILFLIATFGVVVLYLTSPADQNPTSSYGEPIEVPLTEPDLSIGGGDMSDYGTDSLIPESETIDVELAPDAGDPVPPMDPVGDDPLEDTEI